MSGSNSRSRDFDPARQHEPNEKVARFRQLLPEAKLKYEANPADIEKALNYTEMLANAGGCSDCVFRSTTDSTCRAWPARSIVREGRLIGVWPVVDSSDWCASWRAA